jgi:predicted ATPase
MAYPGADIWHFENGHVKPADYTQLEHVVMTRDFLNNPQAYLDELWKDE